MSALNTCLVQWIAAGDEPNGWVLLLGIGFAVWGSALCAAAVLWAGWQHPQDRRFIAATLLGTGLASLMAHAIAAWLHFPRPFVLAIVPAYISHSASASLPSTHATVMFFLGFAFLLRRSLWHVGAFVLATAVATGWARVYVGVHFPFDIVAGFALAAVLAAAFTLTLKFAMRRPAAMPNGAHAELADSGNWRPS